MEIAITVVAAPSQDDLLFDIAAALQRDFDGGLAFRWLSPGEAMDLILPSPEAALEAQQPADFLASVKEIIAGAAGDRPVDWCVQRAAGRRKRMLVADMDSTIIGQESIDELAELNGVRAEVAALTERAMRGEIDFETSLRERMRLLRGLTEGDLRRVLDERVKLNAGARTLAETMNKHGAHTMLISSGFTVFTSAVAAQAGFRANRGNALVWESGALAGVAEPILGREGKLAAFKEEAAAHGLSPEEAIAVGDGANDLDMLGAAGLGVAYRAKPMVAARAHAQVRHTDLAALLYFQGYKRTCFAS